MGNLLKSIGINKQVGSVVNPITDGSVSLINRTVDVAFLPTDLLKSMSDNPSTMTILIIAGVGIATLLFLKK